MKVHSQSPFPIIKIYEYSSPNPNKPKIEFTYFQGADINQKSLLSYNFMESVNGLGGNFSFSIASQQFSTNNNKTLFDEIKLLDVVEIYEGSSIPSFRGIIKNKKHSVKMGSSGAERQIVFSGKSICSVIGDFQVSLDLAALDIIDKTELTSALTRKFEGKGSALITIKDFLNLTWICFKDIASIVTRLTGNINIDLESIIDKYILANGAEENFFIVNNSLRFLYPISNVTYNQGINTITKTWQTMLPKPVYEIFDTMNKNGKSKIVVRKSPFNKTDWLQLPHKVIQLEKLIGYDFNQSDTEIYTAFMPYIEGSTQSPDYYQKIDITKRNNYVILQTDFNKIKKYGYKLLSASFNGYDRNKNSDELSVDLTRINSALLSEELKNWFSKLDEMFTGIITQKIDFIDKDKNVRAGEVVKFMGGEFYVTKIEHTWIYGGIPTAVITVSRGGKYNNGEFVGTLQNIGKPMSEFIL